MKILLTGASGFIGKHLLYALQQNAYSVTACTHRNSIESSTKTRSIKIDFMQMQHAEDWLPHLKNIDVVINSVGIITETKRQKFAMLHYRAPVSLFQACEIAGVQRLIQISALGADDTPITPYHRSKKSADDVLRNSSLNWFILQPALIYGEGGKSSALFQRLSHLPVIPLIGEGLQMIQPVHISDVVATVLCCLDQEIATQQTIKVVGEHAISYKDWLISLRNKQSKAYFLKIPLAVLMPLSRLTKALNLSLLTPDNLRMLQQNNVASSTKLSKPLGRKPRSPTQRQRESLK